MTICLLYYICIIISFEERALLLEIYKEIFAEPVGKGWAQAPLLGRFNDLPVGGELLQHRIRGGGRRDDEQHQKTAQRQL